jgi:hypothetical protein
MDHVAGPLHIMLAGKEGRIWFNTICLKSINLRELLGGYVCIEIWYGICPIIYPTGKNVKKITVSRNLRQPHLLEMDLMKIPGDHETLSIVRHVGLHVDLDGLTHAM